MPAHPTNQKTLNLHSQNPNIHVGNLSIVLPKGDCGAAFAHRLPPGTPEFNVGKHTLKKQDGPWGLTPSALPPNIELGGAGERLPSNKLYLSFPRG